MKNLKDYLGPDDIIIEEGENERGEYIKCKNGKLYMTMKNGAMPCESVIAPELLDSHIVLGTRWI